MAGRSKRGAYWLQRFDVHHLTTVTRIHFWTLCRGQRSGNASLPRLRTISPVRLRRCTEPRQTDRRRRRSRASRRLVRQCATLVVRCRYVRRGGMQKWSANKKARFDTLARIFRIRCRRSPLAARPQPTRVCSTAAVVRTAAIVRILSESEYLAGICSHPLHRGAPPGTTRRPAIGYPGEKLCPV